MGDPGDGYLRSPDPRGPIYGRFSFRIPGDPEPRRFVKSLGTSS